MNQVNTFKQTDELIESDAVTKDDIVTTIRSSSQAKDDTVPSEKSVSTVVDTLFPKSRVLTNIRESSSASDTSVLSELAVTKKIEELSLMLETLLEVSNIYEFYTDTPPMNFKRADGSVISNASTEVPVLYEALQQNKNTWKLKSESEWINMQLNYGGIGGAPFFVLNTSNNTIRLPDTRGMYSRSGSESVGTVLQAGIPNITGSVSAYQDHNHTAFNTATGTFSLSYYIAGSVAAPGSYSGAYSGVTMDASRSSSVYGKSTTVTPNTYVTMDCVYVGSKE